MSAPERRAESRKWLQYAREDLEAAQSGLTHPGFTPRHSCYDAQQAVEKAIKGALVLLDIPFLYRHDLEYLNSLLPTGWQLDNKRFDLEQMTDWAVMSRYPGD